MEIETIILGNGNEYLILDSVDIDGVKYTLFSNVNNEKDICFRKTVVKGNEKYYVGLDNDEEFEKVLLAFNKELKGLSGN